MCGGRIAALVVGLCTLSPLVATPAGAATFRSSLSREGLHLNADDTRMMEGAINQALEQRKQGATSVWSNSGHLP